MDTITITQLCFGLMLGAFAVLAIAMYIVDRKEN